jgi:NAD(P)-dependent dehydrogenase (short-subunit alcohol dehydrogenase family)
MGSIKKAFDLTGKNALVTGGSRGLGLQIAEALGEQGARVLISSRKAPDLEKAQEHLAGLGIKAEWIAADNSRDEDVTPALPGARRPRITRSKRGTR